MGGLKADLNLNLLRIAAGIQMGGGGSGAVKEKEATDMSESTAAKIQTNSKVNQNCKKVKQNKIN